MQEISRTKYARNLHKYANEKYAIYMCIISPNCPKICINIQVYADVCVICIRVNMTLYEN